MRGNQRTRSGAIWLVFATIAMLVGGCGGYASRSEQFRRSLTSGQPDKALARVNKELKVAQAKDLPPKGDPDTALLLLERATILQAIGEYELSARDFQVVDQSLDVLDLTTDTAGDIGKYLYSDDATVYRAPPHEKLLLNTLNLVNYLARGELSGAKIEARRFTINRKYLEHEKSERRSMMALGSYLAGFAFEKDGQPGAAMRYYAEAHEAGGVPTLVDALTRLARRSGESDPRVRELIESAGVGEAPPVDETMGELLVIVQTGAAPYRYPERMPIGAAVVAASSPGPGARLSADERRNANLFAAKGVLKWVNYPKLRRVKTAASRRIEVAVDGRGVPGGEAIDVEQRVVEEFRRVEGSLLAAGIVRLIARAVAGEASQAVAKKATDNALAGLLIGLVVEGAMTAADTPDTRGWVTLPARIYVARIEVPAGPHRILVRGGGANAAIETQVPAGGWRVVNISSPR